MTLTLVPWISICYAYSSDRICSNTYVKTKINYWYFPYFFVLEKKVVILSSLCKGSWHINVLISFFVVDIISGCLFSVGARSPNLSQTLIARGVEHHSENWFDWLIVISRVTTINALIEIFISKSLNIITP